MKSDCISANNQIPDIMFVQQFDEFSEILVQHDISMNCIPSEFAPRPPAALHMILTANMKNHWAARQACISSQPYEYP
jgi:hypothetical protein